jgi:F-type H+-transporting ATPase subunit epsilon
VNLNLLTPTEVLFEEVVGKIVGEAEDGAFGVLPHHVDYVAALVPGLLHCELKDGKQVFFAVDEGVLVKCGPDVFVSTFHAIRGPDLGELRRAVRQSFRASTEREERARTALSRLEADMVRRYLELGE